MEESNLIPVLKQFKAECPHLYEQLKASFTQAREFHFARLRRNIETPNTQSHQYFVITGEMMAWDDFISAFSEVDEK